MGPLPFWQLFSLLGLSCVYQLISVCLSQHINSLSPSLLPSPPAHFPSFFLGARGRLWDGFCWFASGFGLVPVFGCLFAVCILYLSLYCCLFCTPFEVSVFGFRLWLTCGVGEAGLTLVDQRFDCICAWFRCFGCFYLCSRLFMCICLNSKSEFRRKLESLNAISVTIFLIVQACKMIKIIQWTLISAWVSYCTIVYDHRCWVKFHGLYWW